MAEPPARPVDRPLLLDINLLLALCVTTHQHHPTTLAQPGVDTSVLMGHQ
jgi:hypothetical protein